ncbi:helix-turn-helix transcriptional regulator [Luteolibacter pohnpeiensis]|uniref:Helix-turn-helix transcriptional regulator n=1 Tax=Luteolibacter pohnpeiensis TaxID=454153 RepID=A0A934S698_9BACT|nr:AraC family transcriptional regulator [Luteolibacter pohnpeiensis]MBK1883870.1 helix-turn-helix transcriptional regulator [Luteolibacter pohnpeiensis]
MIAESDHVTRSHVVRSDSADQRDWLRDQPVCSLLRQHHIAHVEIVAAVEPFQMVRQDQSGTFMLACFGGAGLVLVDGKWQRVSAGEACLLPPFVTNGMRALGPEPWLMCGVRYLESRESQPVISHRSPVRGAFDSTSLLHAIKGLHAESCHLATPALMHLWTELIHSYVLKFAEPHRKDARLWKLWERVQGSLGHDWSLDELALHACLSKEHLRKLCRAELGRTPMQQVTFLRMQHARHVLSTTDEKIESISRQVGYLNPFTFSNTFQKWIGWRPSEIRKSARSKTITNPYPAIDPA